MTTVDDDDDDDDDDVSLLLGATCEWQGSGVWHDPRDKRGRETREVLCEYGQFWWDVMKL